MWGIFTTSMLRNIWKACKISGLNWTTETKGSKWPDENQRLIKSLWSGWQSITPLRAKMARGYKLYRRLRRGGAQKCHLVIFSKKPIDKIRPLCYTFIKEVQVLLWLIEICEAFMKRMNEEKLNKMAEFIHRYVRENNGETNLKPLSWSVTSIGNVLPRVLHACTSPSYFH